MVDLLTEDPRIKRIALLWGLVGFGVGALWVWLAFANFTSRAETTTFDFVGYLTCPPLMLTPEPVDLLFAPSLNGVLYGTLALVSLTRRRK